MNGNPNTRWVEWVLLVKSSRNCINVKVSGKRVYLIRSVQGSPNCTQTKKTLGSKLGELTESMEETFYPYCHFTDEVPQRHS